jgi:RNA polymerase sigma-70 factor (ECF subfamily)
MSQPELETLYVHFKDRLCRFICSRMPGDAEAEDIVQEVFLRIHTHLDTIREVDKIEGWMYQVARNSITDYYRRQQRLTGLVELPVEDTYPEKDAAESLAPSVRELVDTLPEPYKQAILLTEYQGLSQKELAETLGISLSGAKSRVQRARQKIYDELMNCCHFEFDRRGALLDYCERCCCCDDKNCS